MPELWNPLPFHDDDATTWNFGFVCEPPFGVFCGSPGPPAGVRAGAFRCTVPSGASLRMSLFALVELNVIVCGPMTYQVTEPPTGILVTFGPNSVICASITAGDPEPVRM